jgi:large subunit ribosomal protein L6
MSRIGKNPVPVPADVKVAIDGRKVVISGPAGELPPLEHRPEVEVNYDEGARQIVVTRKRDDGQSRAFHGLTRALIQNMVAGAKEKYEKRLEIVGVGYQASISGDTLVLRVGYANEIKKKIPKSLEVTCPDATHVVVRGCNKQQVGQFAAEVRAARKPEPYKGKGVRYQGEQIKLKPGKAAS